MNRIVKKYGILIGIVTLMTLSLSMYSFAQIEELKLRVDGLACPFCAYGLEKKLKSLEGIESFNISLKKGTAELKFKEDNNVDFTRIKSMVKDAGYTLKGMEIIATGTIYKDEGNLLFNIKGNQNKLYIFEEDEQKESKGEHLIMPINAELKKKLEGFFKNKTLVKITGSIHGHPDGSFGLSIQEYSVQENKK